MGQRHRMHGKLTVQLATLTICSTPTWGLIGGGIAGSVGKSRSVNVIKERLR